MEEFASIFEGVNFEKAKIRSYNVKDNNWSEDEIVVKIAKDAFAQGALRAAYHMLRYNSEEDDKPQVWVAKLYMKSPETGHKAYEDDVILQTVAAHYGNLYNQTNPPKKVEFMKALVMKMHHREEVYAIEPYIVGDYTKHSNNVGFIDFENWRNTPHAFSHFTYHISNHTELVCDIQGVNDLYTDPQLHAVDITKYGTGNLARRGIALFFYTHRCNPLCSLLKLNQFEHYNTVEVIDREKIEETLRHPESPGKLALWRNTTMSSSFASIVRVFAEQKKSQTNLLRQKSKSNIRRSTSEGDRAKAEEIKSAYRAMDLSNSQDNNSNDSATTTNPEHIKLLRIPSAFEIDMNDHHLLEIGKIHRELADMMEHGRLSVLDELMFHFDTPKREEDKQQNKEETNFAAIIFHYQKAAEYGDIFSMLILARIFTGTTRDFLPGLKLENPSNAFKYLKLAAKKGCISASYHVAQCYHHGYYNTPQNWEKAVQYYDKLLSCEYTKPEKEEENLHDFHLESLVVYEIAAAIADLYEQGGHSLEQDYTKAAEYYSTAAESAMEHKKGKLSAQFYEKSELCYSM